MTMVGVLYVLLFAFSTKSKTLFAFGPSVKNSIQALLSTKTFTFIPYPFCFYAFCHSKRFFYVPNFYKFYCVSFFYQDKLLSSLELEAFSCFFRNNYLKFF